MFEGIAARADATLRRSSRIDPFDVIAPLVASIGDAHTSVSPYTSGYVTFRDRRQMLFPFELRHQDQSFVITRSYVASLSGYVGTSILAINGIPISNLWQKLVRDTSAEREAFRDWQISDDIRPLLWHTGILAPFHITLRRSSDSAQKIVTRGCTIDAIHKWDGAKLGDLLLEPYELSIDPFRKLALMRVHSFDADDKTSFEQFITSSRNEMEQAGVEDLLIDVRNNSGGSTVLSDDLVALFAHHPYRTFSRSDVRISSFAKQILGHDDYVDRFGDAAWSLPDGLIVHTAFPTYTRPLAAPHRFRGRTYILVGSGTFSTGAIFAATAQDSHNAVILGRESGGLPSLYGETVGFSLPKSGLYVSVSTKYLVRSNGDTSVHGVIPTHRFDETPEDFDDPELAQSEAFVLSQR